jgi:hypothetical protein
MQSKNQVQKQTKTRENLQISTEHKICVAAIKALNYSSYVVQEIPLKCNCLPYTLVVLSRILGEEICVRVLGRSDICDRKTEDCTQYSLAPWLHRGPRSEKNNKTKCFVD